MSVAEDIGALKAHTQNLVDRMDRMAKYMERGDDWKDQAGKDLALLVKAQKDTETYQKKCDDERDDHEKRLAEVEGFQKRLIKAAVVVTGCGSLLSPYLAKLWERLFT